MNKPKHSPFPWLAYNSIGSRILSQWRVRDANGQCVIRIHSLPVAPFAGAAETEYANAKLVASIPDLVATVRALRDAAVNTPALDSSEDWSALIAQADKTLSEATGETRLFTSP